MVMDQLELLKKSFELNQRFTKLMLEGGELPDLVQEMAFLLKKSVCIEDPAYYIIADVQMGEVDAARFQSVQYGRSSRNLTQGLIDQRVYHKIEKERKPLFVKPIPDIGMTNGRIIAPIIIDQTIHGTMWIISNEPLGNPIDELIIEQGITAAALIMLKDKAAREARYALSGDFFGNLLQGQDDEQLMRQAERLNYQFDQPRQILLINGVSSDGGSQQSVSKALELWQIESKNMGLKAWHNDQLVLMLANGETSYGVQIAKAILEILHHPEWDMSIGVGQAYQEATPAHVRQSYLEAREALQVGKRMAQNTAVYPFNTLGLHHWLNHLTPQQINNNHFMTHVATIVAYDQKHQAELIKTVELFLENRLSLAKTAVDLHIHRNTLIKRLHRIEQLTGLDLEKGPVLYNLYAALIVYKLS